jgi:hypothetical protein
MDDSTHYPHHTHPINKQRIMNKLQQCPLFSVYVVLFGRRDFLTKTQRKLKWVPAPVVLRLQVT